MYVCRCVHVSQCPLRPGLLGPSPTASPKLELKVVVSSLTWVLGIKLTKMCSQSLSQLSRPYISILFVITLNGGCFCNRVFTAKPGTQHADQVGLDRTHRESSASSS